MKVFWLTKYTEEKDLPLYRCMKEPENIYSINIKEGFSFNYLVITNPENSNLIYIIHHLNFDTYESNKLKLYMIDSINLDCKRNQSELLEIRCLDNNVNDSDLTELSTTTDSYRLLADNYIILIPGGNIIIKTTKPILKAQLDIKYNIEEL